MHIEIHTNRFFITSISTHKENQSKSPLGMRVIKFLQYQYCIRADHMCHLNTHIRISIIRNMLYKIHVNGKGYLTKQETFHCFSGMLKNSK